MAVAVEQRHVPFHAYAKARIAIGVDREIAQKKNRQIDPRTRRQMTEQGRLVLDRMRDQARNAVRRVHEQLGRRKGVDLVGFWRPSYWMVFKVAQAVPG